MKQYTARASRDGKFWLVHVPEIDQYTQARKIAEIPVMATELVQLMTEEDPDTFAVDVQIAMPESVTAHLERSAELREQAAAAQHRAAEESRLAARELKDLDIPLRDVGELLGISYQRVHQLVSGA